MIIKQIMAHNFVTYESLNLQFPEKGIIGIEGRNLDKPVLDTNACGKTLILDMISYALYGEVLRKKAANVIGPFDDKMVLSVAFLMDGPSRTIIIKRERKGANELVKIKIDGKVYNGKQRKMQPIIDRLVGIEWLTFQNCILYGNSLDSNFMYVGHSKRIEILAQIAGILHLREARKLINPDLKEAEKEVEHSKGKLETIREARVRTKRSLNESQQRLKNIETEQEDAKKLLAKSLVKIKNDYDSIDSKTLEKEIVANTELINNIKKQSLIHEKEKNEILSTDPKKQLENAIKEKAQIETLQKKRVGEIEKLKKSGECPLCLSKVNELMVNQLSDQIPKLNGKIIHNETTARKLIDRVEELDKLISKSKDTIKRLIDEIAEKQLQIKNKSILISQIDSIENQQKAQKNIVAESELRLEHTQQEYDEISDQLLKEFFGNKSKRINRDVLQYWNEKFSPRGAEAELIIDLVGKLQAYANNYIHKLTDGSISIYITPHRESKSGAVKQELSINIIENGEEKDFDLYSGGQINRIEKAIRLGLMKILTSYVGFKLFDEIGKDLSTKGYEEAIKLMREIFYEQQIFLVTNDRESKKLFDHHIRVTLSGGKSKIDHSWETKNEEKEIT